MSNQTTILSQFEWDAVIEGIRNNQCILCIGPNIATIGEDKDQSQKLTEFLQEHQDSLKIKVQENGWFHLQKGGSDGPAYQAIRSFYKGLKPTSSDILSKIAALKFHLVLSLSPDYHLREAYEEQNLPYRFDAYTRNEPDRNTEVPTAEVPLLYNLVGELGNRNSLVLTFDDFFDYLESIFRGNSMSTMLKNNILDAQYFLFIGMPFEQWFVHLFMRILRQHRERKTKFATGLTLTPEELEIAAEQYNIKFVNSNITGFIHELYDRCNTENLIKSPKAPVAVQQNDLTLFAEYEEMLIKNQFDRIIEKLKDTLRGVGESAKPLLIRVIQLGGRHSTIKEHINLGIIKYEEQTHQLNLLRKDFMDLLSDLKSKWNELNIRL